MRIRGFVSDGCHGGCGSASSASGTFSLRPSRLLLANPLASQASKDRPISDCAGKGGGQGRGRTADLPLFRRGVRQVDAPSCERCGSSPVIAVSRWLLPLLSTLLSARLPAHSPRVARMTQPQTDERLRPHADKMRQPAPRRVRSARCARPSRASSPPPLPSRPGRRCSGSGRGTP